MFVDFSLSFHTLLSIHSRDFIHVGFVFVNGGRLMDSLGSRGKLSFFAELLDSFSVEIFYETESKSKVYISQLTVDQSG